MPELSTQQLVVALVFGLGLVAAGGFVYFDQAQKINSWTEAEATVLESDVDRLSSQSEVEYRPNIRYRYSYDGKTYTSDNVYPTGGRKFGNAVGAENFVDQYPEGETVTAHVNPSNPDRAFLVANHSWLPILLLLGFGGLITFGAGARLAHRVYGVPIPAALKR